MIIATGLKRPARPVQPSFWPDALDFVKSRGELRYLVGDFVEDVTAGAVPGGADRIATDSRADYCPDLIGRVDGSFIEAKAVGRSGHIIAYDCRLERDARFVASGRRLFYWVWYHRFAALSVDSRSGLYAGVASSIRYAVVVDFADLTAAAARYESRVLNSGYFKPAGAGRQRCGYTTNGYGVGKAIRVTALRARCDPVPVLIPQQIVRGAIVPPTYVYAGRSVPFFER